MASIIRSAKSVSDWTSNELHAFNIQVQDVDIRTFFGVDQLPDLDPTALQVILNNERRPDNPNNPIPKSARLFFTYLDRARTGLETHVDVFAMHLLRMMDFDDEERAIFMRRELSFDMCGSRVFAMPDLCVMGPHEHVLLVQKDKRGTVTYDAVPQLVAEAIAAFVHNAGRHPPPPQHITFPAIIMRGVSPVFYKIPITQELITAVSTAQYPQQPTIVQKFVPPVPDVNDYLDHGMATLENRRAALQCFEALKHLLVQ